MVSNTYTRMHSYALNVVLQQYLDATTDAPTGVSEQYFDQVGIFIELVTSAGVNIVVRRNLNTPSAYIEIDSAQILATRLSQMGLSSITLPDECLLVHAELIKIFVMTAEVFVGWYASVVDEDVVEKFVDDVNKINGVFVAMPTKKQDKPAADKPTTCIFNRVIMDISERWVREHSTTGMTPQEYQQAYLRDCSDAYATLLANKSPFKITFS